MNAKNTMASNSNTLSTKHVRYSCNTHGGAIAVWNQFDGEFCYVWAALYTPGFGWSSSQQLENNAGHAFNPRTSINRHGDAVVTWHQDDGMFSKVWFCWFKAGVGWHMPSMLDVETECDAFDSQVVIDDFGNAVAIWTQFDGQYDNIWTNRFSVEIGWGSAQRIQTDANVDASDPEIDLVANSVVVARWRQCDVDGDHYWSCCYRSHTGWDCATKQLADIKIVKGAALCAENVRCNWLKFHINFVNFIWKKWMHFTSKAERSEKYT